MNPTLIGLTGLLVFSIGPTLYAFGAALPPFEFLAMVSGLGYVGITLTQAARGRDIIAVWRQPPKIYAFVFCAVGLYNLLYLLAIQNSEAFTATALNYLWPVLLAVFAAYIDGRSLDRFQKNALLCGALGTALIFLPLIEGEIGKENFVFGCILAIAGAALWAFYSATSKKYSYSSGFLAPVMLLASFMFAALHFTLEITVIPSLNLMLIVAITGLTRFCYVMWDIGIREGNRVLLSSFSYFTPLWATSLLMAFGFLPPHPLIAAAAVLIIMACVFTNAKTLLKLIQGLKKRNHDPAL